MNIGTVGLTITLFDLYTVRSGAAISDKTDMTALVAADSAHSDGKAYELGFGLYRIDVADVFAAGSPRVTVIVVDQNGDVTMMEVEIDPGITQIKELRQRLCGEVVVINETAKTIDVHDTDGSTPLFTETAVTVGDVTTLTRS